MREKENRSENDREMCVWRQESECISVSCNSYFGYAHYFSVPFLPCSSIEVRDVIA